eukprot:Em0001g243a
MLSIAVRVGLAVILLHFSFAHNYGSDSDYANDADYSNAVGLDSIAARFDEGVKENKNVDESFRHLIQAMIRQDQISGQPQEAEERLESISPEGSRTTQRSCC